MNKVLFILKYSLSIYRNFTGNNPMEEELCLVDSATANTILRENKILPNSYKEKGRRYDHNR